MRIVIPVLEDKGLDSPLCGHFGSAPFFAVADGDAVEVRANAHAQHEHGMCRPLAAIEGQAIEAALVGGIGAGALTKLQAAGVRVYQAQGATIRETLQAFSAGTCPELQVSSCAGHHH